MSRGNIEIVLDAADGYEAWRDQARRLIAAAVPPETTAWRERRATPDLFAGAPAALPRTRRAILVPKGFPPLAERVACHRDPRRFELLYRLLWRLQSERSLLDVSFDADVALAAGMARSVRRDMHKMKAFVRFRRVRHAVVEAYVAWFEPEHHILKAVAPFFMRRYTGMRWSILTPEASAHWDGDALTYGPGAARADCPDDDALEAYWTTYYASIFNPARLKVDAMRAEMPRKYWRNLPEARLIPTLVRDGERAQRSPPPGRRPAAGRARQWIRMDMAEEKTPRTLDELAACLEACRRCPIGEQATRAVPGEGPADAGLMLVGEQPGDREDLTGRPFVGPAGRLLDEALAAAGIERERIFLTNAVKHFKFRLQGKRRLHQKPDASEIDHCRWWLGLELGMVAPRAVVALGATAARSLLGRPVAVGEDRGSALSLEDGTSVWITVHPSYVLRQRDEQSRERELRRLVADLRKAAAQTVGIARN
ncbi:UdgX family uracil-DNA binding protein [Lentisalinibacter orientalis]|uniref:UdgX family uracil-DNA binding protein n=1 Tax=Lentisalinibacter orientalis TaxID=2992241 RepID=UPI00386E1001